MPYGTPGGPASPVIYIALEDDPTSSTVHRLSAARANLANVIDASERPDGTPFDITCDLGWLRQVSYELGGVRLVVIYTLSASAPVSLTAVATVRNKVLRPILQFAKDTGCAVLLVHHTTKQGEISGSKVLVDGVRQVLTIAKDPADPRTRVLSVYKSNVASDSAGDVKYTLQGDGTYTCVSWLADQNPGPGPAGNGEQ